MTDIGQNRDKPDRTKAPGIDLIRRRATERQRNLLESGSRLASIQEVSHLQEAHKMWGDSHPLTLLFEKIHKLEFIPKLVWGRLGSETRLRFSDEHDEETVEQFREQAAMIHKLAKEIKGLEKVIQEKSPSTFDALVKESRGLTQVYDDWVQGALNANNRVDQARHYAGIMALQDSIKAKYEKAKEELDREHKKFLEDKLRETEELERKINSLYEIERKRNSSDFDSYMQIIKDIKKVDDSEVIKLSEMIADFSKKEREFDNKMDKLEKASGTMDETNKIIDDHYQVNLQRYSLERVRNVPSKLSDNASLSEYTDYISGHNTSYKNAIEKLDQLKEQLNQKGITAKQRKKILSREKIEIANANSSIEYIRNYSTEFNKLFKALEENIEKEMRSNRIRYSEIGSMLEDKIDIIRRNNTNFQNILKIKLGAIEQV